MAIYDIVCETCGATRRVCRAWHQQRPRFCSRACSNDRNGKTPQDILDRFVDRSDGPDACWPFNGPLNTEGYGVIHCDGKVYRAHRVAWERVNGPMPEGMAACHRCDNRRCCNDRHLFAGTASENAADRHRKAREPKGDRHVKSRLREADIPTIRALEGKVSAIKVGAAYGVSNVTIHRVWERETWKHVP